MMMIMMMMMMMIMMVMVMIINFCCSMLLVQPGAAPAAVAVPRAEAGGAGPVLARVMLVREYA